MHDHIPLTHGTPTDSPIILIHGRGGSAQDMLSFAQHHLPAGFYIALQADNNTWYPLTFTQPRTRNEPALSAALQAIHRVVQQYETHKVTILGFSQGACLASEYAARHPARYRAIMALSGGLIGEVIQGPPQSLQRTPVLIGCSTHDPYIPLQRVEETIAAFTASNAAVQSIIYEGNSHTISAAELQAIKALLET